MYKTVVQRVDEQRSSRGGGGGSGGPPPGNFLENVVVFLHSEGKIFCSVYLQKYTKVNSSSWTIFISILLYAGYKCEIQQLKTCFHYVKIQSYKILLNVYLFYLD